jgi:hypothetical protein
MKPRLMTCDQETVRVLSVNCEQLTTIMQLHLLLFWCQDPWHPVCIVRVLIVSLSDLSQEMSYGLTITPLKRSPKSSDLQIRVRKPVCTVPKCGLPYPSQLPGRWQQCREYVECAAV